MAEVKSNIGIPSNVVIATRWSVFKYRCLHQWWVVKGKVVKAIWEVI